MRNCWASSACGSPWPAIGSAVGVLVERALARGPAYSGYCHTVLALIAHMQRDGDRAEAEIRQANLTTFSLYHAIAAVIYAERGLMDDAHREAALFTELHPSFVANVDSELRKRNVRPEDRARLILGLLQAGAPVPPEMTAASHPAIRRLDRFQECELVYCACRGR